MTDMWREMGRTGGVKGFVPCRIFLESVFCSARIRFRWFVGRASSLEGMGFSAKTYSMADEKASS